MTTPGKTLPRLDFRHRALAALALACLAVAIPQLVIGLAGSLVWLIVLGLVMVLAIMAAWVTVTRRGPARGIAAVVAVVALAVVVVTLVTGADWLRLIVMVALFAVSSVSARAALGVDARTLTAAPPPGRPVPAAAHGVLIMNLKSGGGKAEKFALEAECRERGITPVVLQEDDDLARLAEQAVDDGADVIGMAGGDGSQALIASVAAERGVAYVCVPAGTRNHFALDLGLDREDVVGALEAYGPAVERHIDLASVNGRTFVNNVSLGVYAEVVSSDEYRDAKISTTLQRLPDLLGPEATPFDLGFTGPEGEHHDTAHVIQVSNNSYELHSFTGAGSRPRLDQGVLGIVTVRIDKPSDVPKLLALAQAGRANQFEGFNEWQAPTFLVESGEPVAAGVDGEALSLDPPLEFEVRPQALRVRLPSHAPGWAPAALAQARSRYTIVDLVRVVAGRPAHGRPTAAPTPASVAPPGQPERLEEVP